MKDTCRVLLWPDCNRQCPGCCNKSWDLARLEPIDFAGLAAYETIILTGGEPMLKPDTVLEMCYQLGKEYPNKRIILYTAKTDDYKMLGLITKFVNGLTVTLHAQRDVIDFKRFTEYLPVYAKELTSLRLNVFANVTLYPWLAKYWEVKDNITWIENCPLPKNEDFKRWNP